MQLKESQETLPGTHERVSRALADPQRFAILEAICSAGGEVGCRELVGRFPISQATISHHLKELVNAGLIDGRRDGQCLLLASKPGAVEAYLGELNRRLVPSLPAIPAPAALPAAVPTPTTARSTAPRAVGTEPSPPTPARPTPTRTTPTRDDADANDADTSHADTSHADANHADANHADANHANANHADANHADANHADAG